MVNYHHYRITKTIEGVSMLIILQNGNAINPEYIIKLYKDTDNLKLAAGLIDKTCIVLGEYKDQETLDKEFLRFVNRANLSVTTELASYKTKRAPEGPLY